jgi:endoglucanase
MRGLQLPSGLILGLVVIMLVFLTCLVREKVMKTSTELGHWRGVNLSGAEFGQVPGELFQDYTYPECPQINSWSRKGITHIRYPFRIERLFRENTLTHEKAYLHQLFACAAKENIQVIVDAHNYARLQTMDGEKIIEQAEMAAFWEAFAKEFAGSPSLLAYELMNEPHDLESDYWYHLAQAGIEAIRLHDLETYIVIGGDNWSNAHIFRESNPRLHELTDPQNKLVYTAHFYPGDPSGTYSCQTPQECKITPQGATAAVSNFVDWCKDYDKRCFVGEMGVPYANKSWEPIVTEVTTILRSNGLGFFFWSAGPWWPHDYPLTLESEQADWVLSFFKQE